MSYNSAQSPTIATVSAGSVAAVTTTTQASNPHAPLATEVFSYLRQCPGGMASVYDVQKHVSSHINTNSECKHALNYAGIGIKTSAANSQTQTGPEQEQQQQQQQQLVDVWIHPALHKNLDTLTESKSPTPTSTPTPTPTSQTQIHACDTPMTDADRQSSTKHTDTSTVSNNPEADKLEAQLRQLLTQLQSLQDQRAKLDRHIHMLHVYNEIKDACQSLLGQLAQMEGVCTRDLYPQFSLSFED
jgi:Swi5